MARKKKGGRRNQDDSDDEPAGNEQNKTSTNDDDANAGLSRKQQRQLKLQAKEKGSKGKKGRNKLDDSDDDVDDDIQALISGNIKEDYASESEDDEPQPKKKLTKKQLKRLKDKEEADRKAAAEPEPEPDESEEEEEEEDIPQPAKKGKNKKKGKKAAASFADFGDSSEEELEPEPEDDESEEEDIPQPVKKGKNKKKDQGKKAAALFANFADSSEEEPEPEPESEEDIPEPVKKGKNKKKKKREKAAVEEEPEPEPEADESEEEEEDIPEPVTKGKNKKKKGKKEAASFADLAESSEDEEEPEPEPEPDEDMDSSDDGKKKKKKKDKKKKDKKKSDESLDDEEKAKRKAEKKARKAEKEAKKLAKAMAALNTNDESGDEENDDDEDGVFYGAPDDKAWTDKSHAMIEAEKKKGEGPDASLTHDADGKKLSNKERKRRLKEKEAAIRKAEFEKSAAQASAEGAQFACSQTAVNENDPQWENALDINIPSFNISAAGKILFKDATLNIAHGKRYGLVGPNGRGKSTLLKMIASRDLMLPPRVDFLYVEQEVVADNTPAVEAVLKADKKRWSLLEEEKILSKAIDDGEEDMKKFDRLQQVYDELRAMNADAAEAKARRILYGLGFDIDMQTKPTKMFSGGWRMRISLARALFIEPTLLMLDEPTNHLDLNAVIWLEDYLMRWKNTLFVVSHDQDFLNSVCGEILHIEDLKLISYKGDYDQFKVEQATRLKQQQKDWEKQEKRLRELKRKGQSKAKATETVKKSSKREPGARSKKKQNDAIASGTAAAEATELIKRPREYTVKLEFSEVAELSRPVMEVTNVHFRYSEKHPVIFDHIDFGIDMDSRICVVGPNGAGKSTLLKLLTGEVKATQGEVRRNPRLRMGIYNQHFVDRLPMEKTPVQHLRDRFQDQDYQSVRNRLGRYGLEGHAHEVVMRDLSGGQKARVVFVELSLQRPHILLLDEPTNNLDIETIDALIDAINEFNGGIVVVSHDQRLIEYCECDLWVVEKQAVTKWTAGFDDYKATLLKEMEERIEKENAIRQEKLQAAAAARAEKMAKMSKKLKK